MALKLMYITNIPEIALIAEKNGVDIIWIDLETLGKEKRQKNMDTVKSFHSVDDIKIIKPLLSTSEILVRVNPWNESSKTEIDEVIKAGADIIMLPMWKTVSEVKKFISAVYGRCKIILLLETKEAVKCLFEVLELDGIDEMYIGLNDLHISYGMDFMFELLADGTVEKLANIIKNKGIPYGFGGIARLGDGDLPSENLVMEHYRLGSTRVILSRSFCDTSKTRDIEEIDRLFSSNIVLLRNYEKKLNSFTANDFEKNRKVVINKVQQIVERKRGINESVF